MIELKDNGSAAFDRRDVAPLFPLATKSVAELCQAHPRLLVLPRDIRETRDRLDDEHVFHIRSTADPDRVRIDTGNVVGFIGTGGIHLKIRSRFDDGDGDFFLQYLLQRVLALNLFQLPHPSDDAGAFDLLPLLFPQMLQTALRQGVYREYQRRQPNDAHVRGAVDIPRHIARNIPFAGRIAYTAREYSPDNAVTELIRHAIEHLAATRNGRLILHSDPETVAAVQQVRDITPQYRKSDRRAVIARNLRHRIHPFYTAYRPLQTLCLQLLRHDEVKYGTEGREIHGILIDGAWLWEEYVATLLLPHGFRHPENKIRKGGFPLFEDGSGLRYPDFYKDGLVLDAKYKRLGRLDKVAKVPRDDLHQILAYMYRLGAAHGGFVAPRETIGEDLTERRPPFSENHAPLTERRKPLTATLKDRGTTVSVHTIPISRATDYATFCTQMRAAENDFVKEITAPPHT